MSISSKFVRICVVMFSLTLLAAYVWHSQVTPNMPPPDPLGFNFAEQELEPGVVGFDDEGVLNYGSPVLTPVTRSIPVPPRVSIPKELRIISSKAIIQPVFSVSRVSLPWETIRFSWNRRKGDPFTAKPDIRYEGHGINLSGFARE